MSNVNNYYNNIILDSIVKSWFIDSDKFNENFAKTKSYVEFIITPECSKNCKICYLQKHKYDLYPKEVIVEENIIKNMKKILLYLKNNNKVISSLNLFSGEIWADDIGINILKEIYDFSLDYKFTNRIIIPTNMDFLFVDGGQENMEYFINQFANIGIKLSISASIDGIFLESKYRPQNGKYNFIKDYDYEYYDRIFSFLSKYKFGLHPMVYSKNCKYWCENFDWFMDMINKYYKVPYWPMMLEVRDDNWSDEDIEYYLKFLDHIINWDLENVFQNNIAAFSQYITGIRSYRNFLNNNISLYTHIGKLDCSIQKSLFIRLGDLAVVPCHRTSYQENIYGYIKTDGKKMEVISNNLDLSVKIYNSTPNKDYPKCKDCDYNTLCMKGCLGSQYETNKNMFEPCKTVCKMFKAKIDFLLNKYTEIGVFDILKNFPETEKYVEIIEDFKKNKRI